MQVLEDHDVARIQGLQWTLWQITERFTAEQLFLLLLLDLCQIHDHLSSLQGLHGCPPVHPFIRPPMIYISPEDALVQHSLDGTGYICFYILFLSLISITICMI